MMVAYLATALFVSAGAGAAATASPHVNARRGFLLGVLAFIILAVVGIMRSEERVDEEEE